MEETRTIVWQYGLGWPAMNAELVRHKQPTATWKRQSGAVEVAT